MILLNDLGPVISDSLGCDSRSISRYRLWHHSRVRVLADNFGGPISEARTTHILLEYTAGILI